MVLVLNHFTPDNWLRYVDYAFMPFSGLFHFRAVFPAEVLTAGKRFRPVHETGFGRWQYFKLIMLERV
jgi:phosphatidylethanolamine/phosphatidyl-N-methylethanolamine N-methyltransferase